MRKLKLIFIPLLVAILFIGCAEMFEFSLFDGVDPTPIPDPTAMETTEALAELEESFESPTLFRELEQNVEKKEELSNYLKDVWTDATAEPEEQQKAQILYADLQLQTTGGDEFVNNVTGVLEGLATGEMFSEPAEGEPIQETVKDIFTPLIPGDVEDPAAVADMLDALILANDAYTDFGNSLVTTETPPEGTNMGEVAQSALVTFIVGSVAENILTPEEQAGETDESPGEIIYDLIFTEEGATELDTRLTNISDISLESESLTQILDGAGLALPGFEGAEEL